MQSKLNKLAHRAIIKELNKAISSFMGNNLGDTFVCLQALEKTMGVVGLIN